MKFNPFCMCCAVSKQEQNIRSFQDMDKKIEYMKKVMNRMATIDEEDCAPSVSVELKKMFSDFWDQPMEDYSSAKKEFNQLMLDLEDSLKEKIRHSDDPLETALLYARIGNYIDFAALSDVNSDTVLALLEEDNKDPLDTQEYLHFRKDLDSASRLVYLTDNCGEIVLDKLVIKILKELYPDLDIHAEMRKIYAWLINNTKKRKTKRGMPKFLNGWINRSYVQFVQEPKARANAPKPQIQHNFTQRDYDFDDLEQQLLRKQQEGM